MNVSWDRLPACRFRVARPLRRTAGLTQSVSERRVDSTTPSLTFCFSWRSLRDRPTDAPRAVYTEQGKQWHRPHFGIYTSRLGNEIVAVISLQDLCSYPCIWPCHPCETTESSELRKDTFRTDGRARCTDKARKHPNRERSVDTNGLAPAGFAPSSPARGITKSPKRQVLFAGSLNSLSNPHSENKHSEFKEPANKTTSSPVVFG